MNSISNTTKIYMYKNVNIPIYMHVKNKYKFQLYLKRLEDSIKSSKTYP